MRVLVQRRDVGRLVIIAMVALTVLVAALAGVRSNVQPAHAAPADDFVTVWNTSLPGFSNNSSINITTTGGGYNYDVDWNNDGVFDDLGVNGNISHDYGTPGTYTVRIRGDFPQLRLGIGQSDSKKLINVAQWGSIQWKSMYGAFYQAENLKNVTATDAPDLSQVTNMEEAFALSGIDGMDFSSWDVGTVTNMAGMFAMSPFQGNGLEYWDVSNVENMMYMFSASAEFNGDISSWDVSNVTSMRGMFGSASKFNADISGWDVGSVTDMQEMFGGADVFNANISGWDVSSVTTMSSMFGFANSFTQNLSAWDVSKVTDFSYMFYNLASGVRTDVSQWDISSATNMNSFQVGSPLPAEAGLDKVLAAWAELSVQSNVRLDISGIVCTQDSYDAFIYLTQTKGWTIELETGCYEIEVDSVSIPSISSEDTNISLDVSGNAFFNGAKVYIEGVEASVSSLSGGNITIIIPTFNFTQSRMLDVQVVNPGGFSATLNDVIEYQYVVPPSINSVDFEVDPDDGHHLMIVNGNRMFVSGDLYPKLNGNILPVCVYDSGLSAEDLSSVIGMPIESVSETPPCFMVLEDDGNSYPDINLSVKIWIPNDFDREAPGSFEVGGMVFSFNDEDVDPELIEPTVGLVGGDITATPHISSRPTFTGKAEPGSSIVVTVYSDPISCSATADSNGDWSCTLPTDLPAGTHTVYVRVTSLANVITDLGPYSIMVDGVNPTVLAPNTGFVGGLTVVAQAGKQVAEKYPAIVWMVLGSALTLTGGMIVRNVVLTRIEKRKTHQS